MPTWDAPMGCQALIAAFSGRGWWVFEESEDVSGYVAFEASIDVWAGLTLARPAGRVRDRVRVEPHARQHDGVQRPVELPIAAAVESMLVRHTR